MKCHSLVCFLTLIAVCLSKNNETAAAKNGKGDENKTGRKYFESAKIMPFSLERKYSKNAVIKAGERHIHTSLLQQANLIDLFRIRVRLNVNCEDLDRENLVQVLCDHPSDSVTFYLPTKDGSCEGVGLLGGVMSDDLEANGDEPENISITVTSRSRKGLNYTVIAGVYDRAQYNVELPPSKKSLKGRQFVGIRAFSGQRSSAVEPIAYKLSVDRSRISSLMITLKSDDDLCAIAATHGNIHHLIQSAQEALKIASHITFTRFATLEVPLNALPNSFSLFVFVFGDDSFCVPNAEWREYAKNKQFNITFSTEPLPSAAWPIILNLVVYTCVPVICYSIWNKSHKSNKQRWVVRSPGNAVEMAAIPSETRPLSGPSNEDRDAMANPRNYLPVSSAEMQIPGKALPMQRNVIPMLLNERPVQTAIFSKLPTNISIPSQSNVSEQDDDADLRSLEERIQMKAKIDFDLRSLEERIQQETCIARQFDTVVTIANNKPYNDALLAAATSQTKTKISEIGLPYWIIVPVASRFFYTLYEELVRNGRNEDVCFHNYECSYSVGSLRSFNHIISNFGYLTLGATYSALIRLWQRHFNENNSVGICPPFPILYSLGATLAAEAVASSLYHVCPNSSSYHIDTAYIEIMCVLVMCVLYSQRHGPIRPRFSVILVLMVFFNQWLWTIQSIQEMLAVLQLLGTFILQSKIFFGDHLEFDFSHPYETAKMFRARWHVLLSSAKSDLLKKRLILLSAWFIVNFALMVYIFMQARSRVAYVPLYFAIVNMLAYFTYYFYNKIMCSEATPVPAALSCAIAALLWVISGYLFLHSETDWKMTAAQSRALNRPCVLMNFYDMHDLWHFSSSFAAFFALITLPLIDINLRDTPVSEIDKF